MTIVAVTPNPAIDLTYRVPALEPGGTHRVPTASARAGGKGVNVARVLHQQGRPVIVVGTAGGESGRQLAADLERSGIAHALVPVAADTRRTVAIVDDEGAATVLNETGAEPDAEEVRWLHDRVVGLLPGASCLVGSGSLPPGVSTEFYGSLVREASGRGIPSVIDASGPALVMAAAAGANVLKPNAEELQTATGEADPIRGGEALLALGAGLVLVSLGADGMLALSARGDRWRARLPEPLRGNPTGAGDAAVAAVAAAITEGAEEVPALLIRASAWSAAAVLMPLAGEISPVGAELEHRLIVERM